MITQNMKCGQTELVAGDGNGATYLTEKKPMLHHHFWTRKILEEGESPEDFIEVTAEEKSQLKQREAEYIEGSNLGFADSLHALPALVAMATDVTAGKAAVADALTRAGAPTAPDAPLSEMAEAVGSLPVTRADGGEGDTIFADLPVIVSRNFRADYPYVCAISTFDSGASLIGADAYLARGGVFTTEQEAIHAFPADGRENWLLCFYKSPNYVVPYNTCASPRTVYTLGGHPAFGVENGKAIQLEAMVDEGDDNAPGALTLTGGRWVYVASSLKELSGTLASGCSSLSRITLPALTEMSGGTVASSCAALTAVELPALTEMSGGTVVKDQNSVGRLSLPNFRKMSGGYLFYYAGSAYQGVLSNVKIPSLEEISGGSLFFRSTTLTSLSLPNLKVLNGGSPVYNCSKFTSLFAPALREINGGILMTESALIETLELPELVVLKKSIANGCRKLTHISLPKLREISVESTSDQYIWANMISESILTLDVPELLTAESPDGNTGILGGLGRVTLTVNAPKCVRWHTQISWGAAGGEDRVYLNFGTAIDHIYLKVRTWTSIILNIGEGAICDIQAVSGSYSVVSNIKTLVNALGDNTGNKTRLLQLSSTNLSRLTDEEKAILVAKNYSLS